VRRAPLIVSAVAAVISVAVALLGLLFANGYQARLGALEKADHISGLIWKDNDVDALRGDLSATKERLSAAEGSLMELRAYVVNLTLKMTAAGIKVPPPPEPPP
jgi:hypothetical protein